MDETKLFELGASAARRCSADGTVKTRKSIYIIKDALECIDRACQTSGVSEWLPDNRWLAVREAKIAVSELSREKRLRTHDGRAVILLLAEELVMASGINETSLSDYLRGVLSVSVLPQRELYLFPAALRVAIVERISENDPDRLPELFSSLRELSALDAQALLQSIDPCEALLMQDPAGIYPKMDEDSRAFYRRRLSEEAEKRGVPEHVFAKKLLNDCLQAEGKQAHVGYALTNDRAGSGGLYITANLLITLSLTLLCGFLSRSLAAALLLLLPISELTKSLLDNFLLQCVKPAQLPRLDLSDGIPSEGRTVCVISALISRREDTEALCRRLEELKLSNRSGGDDLLFGILADLPEADSSVTDRDAALIGHAKSCVETLNEKYGGFYLFLRPRRMDKKTKRWSGFERKRGAVLALAKLLCRGESELRIVVGDKKKLYGTRYILTLDSDTRPYPDSLTELVGTMLHPLNAPVLDRERGLVTEGHGLLHPRMATTLSSATATDFARLFAGVGGSEPYSLLCGEIYMDLFRRGGFSGKGIIDAECLLVCSEKHIPDGRILSHDAPEGAYLRGGFVSGIEFSDSFPASPISYYRRSHRWLRGDWQNIGFVFKRSSDLPDIERFRLFDSLRRSLTAPLTLAAVFFGLLRPEGGLLLALTAALLALCTRLLIALTEFVTLRSGARSKTHSRLLHGLGAAILQTLVRLWLLPYEAWISVSAIFTSLWRLLVSKKRLLQWETSAQSELKKRNLLSYAANMWFAPAVGAVLLILGDAAAKSVGLFWLTAPLCALALSVPSRKITAPTAEQKAYVLRCAEDIWGYFEAFCTEDENFLPPDNFQEQPPVGLAHRTSPTNIGLALVSALCAVDLGIDWGKAMRIINGILSTVEKLPKWRGHLYNWYDTQSLRPLSPRYISTVDSGNFLACLVCLKNGLIAHNRPELAERVRSLLDATDMGALYDRKRGLFRIGIDIDKNEPSPAHYDLFAGEARLTGYLSIARGDVPRRHWRSLSRAMKKSEGYSGMASWTGTMFEYLLPELFLPLVPDSLLYETAHFCLHAQKKRRSPTGVWGISESAYFALDPSLSVRYKAHGCAALALKRGQDAELVISPYSSFLALAVEPDAAVKNLIQLEKTGAVGRFGFFEAIDFTPTRCPESGERVRCFMAHHLGMSLLAAANYCRDGLVRRWFMAEPSMRAYAALLEEKLPIDPPTLRLNEPDTDTKRKQGELRSVRSNDVDFENPGCTVLSNGKYNVMSTESSIVHALCGDMLVYRTPRHLIGDGHGAELYFESGGERISLLPELNGEYECFWELGEAQSRHSLTQKGLKSEVRLSVSGLDCGELRQIGLTSDADLSGRLVFECEPVLCREKDHVNHPAYWRLGMEAFSEAGCLLLRRLPRGDTPETWLCLACDREMKYTADRSGGLGSLAEPCIRAEIGLDLKVGHCENVRLALCTADSVEDAFLGAQRVLHLSPGDFGVIPSLCAARLGLDAKESEKAMELLLPLRFPRRAAEPAPAKTELWRWGISGDAPILLVPNGREPEKTVLHFCLLRLSGVSAELVICADEAGDYDRPVFNAVSRLLCSLGLETLLDSDIHILPAEAEETIRGCAALVIGTQKPERITDRRYKLPAVSERRTGSVPEYRFTENNEFEFYVNNDLPSRAWTQMLTNGEFGYLASDSGMGNMWYMNAHEGRVNLWLNDPRAVMGAETVELVKDGKRISVFAANDGYPCRVCFGFGYAQWEKSVDGGTLRTTAFVPPDVPARVLLLEYSGEDAGLHWRNELCLSPDAKDATAIEIDYVNHMLHARSARFPYGGELLLCASEEPSRWTDDLYAAMRDDYETDVPNPTTVYDAVYSLDKRLVLVCGFCDENTANELCKQNSLEITKEHWYKWVSRLQVRCPDKAAEHYMSGWALYQTLASRLMGRSSIYQSGGAVGFRDQLQDALNLLLISPELAKNQIRLCCRHQYLEGDVMHWWHALPEGDKGVRTRCSDDLLWLVWALCEYADKTGDLRFCTEQINYVNSKPLEEAERDRYEMPDASPLCSSVLEHAERAIEQCIERGRGPHGLLLFGSGDWNDGMDKIGGESVWLSFFFASVVRRFSELLILLCKPNSERYRACAEEIGLAADAAFDSDRYLRGYWTDGSPLGENGECRLDCLVQAWAAMSPYSSNSRADAALDTALRELYDRKNGLVKLLDAPFHELRRDPGYIRGYGRGFRENGGQYTHAAIWLAQACLQRDRADDGLAILHDLLPETHDAKIYEAEPFVLPADIITAPGHIGKAGWTWYTGSAGWYFRVYAEEVLGLKLRNGRLYIRPCIENAEIRLPGLKIGIKNREITVNGEKYDGKGIPYLGKL